MHAARAKRRYVLKGTAEFEVVERLQVDDVQRLDGLDLLVVNSRIQSAHFDDGFDPFDSVLRLQLAFE